MAVGSGPAIGAELGGYRLEALVGRGGMSAVYRAEDLRLGRRVALKFLAPELAQDARFRERFLAESRLAASLDHANIVPIFEAGETDGLLYIAMRYVEGTDLRALLARDGPLPAERAVDLVAQLAGALDAAHARGLVHRDVKPSNALVAIESGVEHVYLADFGLTKHTTSRGGPTATGQMVGTVDYVAPEQIRGEAVDGRADLYSLGCVLYECLTGEVPFPRGSEVATIYAHLEEDPPRPSERRPGVAGALDAAVVRAMAKAPERRWQSAAELTAAARVGLPAGQPPLRVRRFPRPSRLVTLAALGFVIALAAAVAALLTAGGGHRTLATIDANAVAVIDPARRSLIADVAVAASPAQVATGERAVWVTDAETQTVSRIDPATYTIRQTIDVGSGAGPIAVGEHGVWVVNTLDGTVSWISPADNREVKRIPVGNGPSGICVGRGAVWVANADDRTIWKLDPRNARHTKTIHLSHRPTALACGGGAVWAGSESSGTVTEIAAATGQEVQPIDVGGSVSALAFGGGALWVVNALNGTVSEIDPLRGAVASTVSLGAGAGSAAIAADAHGAWVSNEFAGTVVRVDRSTGRIAGSPLHVGNRPQGVAIVGGRLWLGVGASGARHRGGTLRILSELTYKGPPDPADAGTSVLTSQIANIAYDGLTAFRRVGGRPGETLVPDLAVALPTPTDGARTYTFRLRQGIRYSTGETVDPADIRRGLERTLRAGNAGQGPFFADILGAGACLTRPSACDLQRGIVVDDATSTITFHLSTPDPDFPTKLALPGAVAVPSGSAAYPVRRALPATGPYLIAGFEPDRFIRLVRNPRFHVWSAAAKPDGYPDEITVRLGSNQAAAVHAVERGAADYVFGEVQHESPGLLSTLFTRYASQVHTNSQFATRYLFLNTRVPPFDDVNVRRAVNYALDRRAAVDLEGGQHTSQPTCQILPPNFPGYVPRCPYTAHPGSGRQWTAPDLRKARRLIASSHERGTSVDVWAPDPEMSAQARLAVGLLDTLGFRARLRLLPFTRYWHYISDSRHKAQIGAIWWGSDFPAASDYLQQLFACRSFHPDDPANVNWSEFCDPEADRLMERARRLQSTDATAANFLWARAERRMVDQAAALPLDNPRQVDVVSRRVGNYQYSPQWGILVDQLWVR